MKYLDYLFLRVFRWYEKKDKDIPFFASCTFSSLIVSLTIINILILLEVITGGQLLYADKTWIFIIMSIILVFFLLRYKKATIAKIQLKFQDESIILRKKRGFIVVGYILFVFLFPLVRAYIQHHT